MENDFIELKSIKDRAKACPFCGSNNIYAEKYLHTAGERWRIFCAHCMGGVDRGYDQQIISVLEVWNNRAKTTD